jgi:glycine cleavage system transcriptional repressor
VLVGGVSDALERIAEELPDFGQRNGLSADLRHSEAQGPTKPPAPARSADALPYRLVGTGIDQPGLVHHISHVLRKMNVNIENLETRLTPAPYTGAPMFELEAILAVPRATQLSQLRQKLGAACDEVNIDWDLRTV